MPRVVFIKIYSNLALFHINSLLFDLCFTKLHSELLRFPPHAKSKMKMDFGDKGREPHHPAKHHLPVPLSEKPAKDFSFSFSKKEKL